MRALHQRQGSDESTDDPTRRRLLRGVLGVAASTTAISVLSGVATAHFAIELQVDIQPENAANFVDLEAHDTVTVAVHTSTFLNSN
ncbi:hypothetical protein [Haloarcula rubra]|uniref:hypothetical protein n=1 Tax=Haloarcula rubra TaxID=2487747 RepID=UPI001F2B66D0|nr:hypothetical protein [Halomicroarcula rubra]